MPPPFSEKHKAALRSNAWFSAIPANVRADILERRQMRSLRPDERCCSRGDPQDGMYAVVDGVLRVSRISEDGEETVLDFYPPGVWVGEVASLDGGPRIYDAFAHGPTDVLHLPSADLEDLIVRHPVLNRALLSLEAARLRIVLSALETYSLQAMEQLIANRLLMLAASFGVPAEQGVRIDLRLPQGTLAQLNGTTRQRVNQIVKSWEKRGLVEQRYGHFVLLEPEALRCLSQAKLGGP
jgi:CRP-like cAMP-binding protein